MLSFRTEKKISGIVHDVEIMFPTVKHLEGEVQGEREEGKEPETQRERKRWKISVLFTNKL